MAKNRQTGNRFMLIIVFFLVDYKNDGPRPGGRSNPSNGRQAAHDRPGRRKPEPRQTQLRDFVPSAPRSPK